MRIAFVGQNVGGDTVKEETIVRDNHGTTGKFQQAFFKRTERINVKVVGRLIEQQYVRARLQHLGKMNTVTFTTGKLTDFFLLVTAFERKLRHIGTRAHRAFRQKDLVKAI